MLEKEFKLEDINDLKSLLRSTLKSFEGSSKKPGFSIKIDFELSPRDYLRFAEDELEKGTTVSLINGVAHLKRALDCQLDIFLNTFNLWNLFKKRNLKIKNKLEFIGAIGYLNSKSLIRLNTIRNKMEHDYAIPNVQDIEVYFDLVTALVHLLELGSFMGSSIEFDCEDEDASWSSFEVEYKRETPEIFIAYTKHGESRKDVNWSVKAVDDIESFAYCFRVMRILNLLWDHQDCHEYALHELELL